MTDATVAARLRDGAKHSLCGLVLTLEGEDIALTDAEFDEVWDLLDEIYGEDFVVRAKITPSGLPVQEPSE